MRVSSSFETVHGRPTEKVGTTWESRFTVVSVARKVAAKRRLHIAAAEMLVCLSYATSAPNHWDGSRSLTKKKILTRLACWRPTFSILPGRANGGRLPSSFPLFFRRWYFVFPSQALKVSGDKPFWAEWSSREQHIEREPKAPTL